MSVVIDVHCHILHADAVEIDSFVAAYAGSGFPLKPPLRDVALWLLKQAVRFRTLPVLCSALENVGARTAAEGPAVLRSLAALPGIAGSPVASRVNAFAACLERNGSPADNLLSRDLPKLGHICQFARAFVQPRLRIADGLLAAYPDVHLFVPLMTDYEEWLGGDPDWRCWDKTWRHCRPRVRYKKHVIRRYKGRMHLFAPFCPLRAAARGMAREVGKVVDLVLNHGFLGVKLYPIMGYYPCDNATRSAPACLPREAASQGVTWQKVDAALDALYAACADNAIPITAHASPQGARGPHGPEPADAHGDDAARQRFFGTANHSHPNNWLPVLARHPDLRLNLAHMGGDHFDTVPDNEKGTERDWAHCTVEAMRQFPHVYSDRSVQVPPDGAATMDAYAARLAQVLAKDPAVVPERMMFGTDWHLVLLYYDYADCREVLARFDQALAAPGIPSGFREKFLGANAAKFLGIESGGAARARLDAYYQRHFGAQRPAWWDAV